MRQAIEEGFILDVLKNYTTYKRFFGLIKQVEHDPEVPKKAAARRSANSWNSIPVNIEQIVQVIIEHFRLKVLHELGGRAKAMVVTSPASLPSSYKQAFDRYIQDEGLHRHPRAGRIFWHCRRSRICRERPLLKSA